MDIQTDSLFVALLLTFSLPLLLTILVAISVMSARSRLRWASRAKKNLQDGTYDNIENNKKLSVALRIAGGLLLLFAVGVLIVFLLILIWFVKAARIDNWIYLLALAILLTGSLSCGILVIWFRYRAITKK